MIVSLGFPVDWHHAALLKQPGKTLPALRSTLPVREGGLTNLRITVVRASHIGLLVGMILLVGCDSPGHNASTEQPPATNASPDDAANRDIDETQASDGETHAVLNAALAHFEQGEWDACFDLLAKQLIKTPDDAATLVLAAKVEAKRGNLDQAIALATAVSSDSPQAVEATNLLVQVYVVGNRPADAIDCLQASLQQKNVPPELAVTWRQQLWTLFNRTGRRQEASVQADVLCRSGRFNRPLLISLLRRNESFPMVLQNKAPEQSFYPGMGLARWYFSQGEFEKALGQLSEQSQTGFSCPAAQALYGRLLAETQALADMPTWYAGCGQATKQFSDYWVALGIYFFDEHQLDASAGALLAAVELDPTDDDACHRLARVLAALDRGDDAVAMREQAIRTALLRSLVEKLSLDQPQSELTDDLPEKLVTLGRPFESIGWALIDLPPGNDGKRNALFEQLRFLRGSPEVNGMASEIARMDLRRDEFNMDEAIKQLVARSAAQGDAAVAGQNAAARPPADSVVPALENVAAKQGIDFQWYHEKQIDLASLPLHEIMGGGISVLDYDRDGNPDVYFGQGSGDPPRERCTRSNQLMRNLDGQFDDVTAPAAAEDFHYSTGIAAGDVNQDGFPDLFLGALGDNRLLINNGDGSFRDASESLGAASALFTSSVAIADLTGDAVPELFEAVYVEMEDGFRLPEHGADGQELVPNPNDFFAESDRWYFGNGDGTFRPTLLDRKQIEPGTGLGVVVTDIDGDGSNDVFVSNDARPNHLLVGFESPPVQNAAVLVGLAYGFRGFSNACMGVATGDFNRDGRIDMHVTNYADEANNHFLQGDSGIFGDFATQYQLAELSRPHVGFGVKAVDFSWNGWPDLFVTNGHVFDQRRLGKRFQMPPQLFSNRSNRFVSSSIADPSGYFDGQYVGRAVAKIDFDRDLDIDLLVGHLDVPVALLRNQTARQGSGLQMELVGTESERDAIGTRVVVKAGGEEFTDWVTAGDGYLCTDEPILQFGLGESTDIDSIEVNWISGRKQIIRDVAAGHRYLIVEGDDQIWSAR